MTDYSVPAQRATRNALHPAGAVPPSCRVFDLQVGGATGPLARGGRHAAHPGSPGEAVRRQPPFCQTNPFAPDPTSTTNSLAALPSPAGYQASNTRHHLPSPNSYLQNQTIPVKFETIPRTLSCKTGIMCASVVCDNASPSNSTESFHGLVWFELPPNPATSTPTGLALGWFCSFLSFHGWKTVRSDTNRYEDGHSTPPDRGSLEPQQGSQPQSELRLQAAPCSLLYADQPRFCTVSASFLRHLCDFPPRQAQPPFSRSTLNRT